MISKAELKHLEKALAQSQARMESYKAAGRGKRSAAAGDDQAVTDFICTMARAFQAECDFLKGKITIAAAIKAAGKPCDCE